MSHSSNSTRGKGTPGARDHSLTESPEQKRDKKRLQVRYSKKKNTRFIRVEADPDRGDPLAPTKKELAAFPSDFAVIRRDQYDNLGYRIPRLVPGRDGEEVRMPEQRGRRPKEEKKKRNRKMPAPYTRIRAGQPDLDAGVTGWIQPEDTREFVERGNRVDSLLETFHRKTDQIIYHKDEDGNFIFDKGKKIEERRIQHVKAFRAETSTLKTIIQENGTKTIERVKTDASTVSYRDTIGVSPFLSRALQRMVEDGHIAGARRALEMIPEPLGRFYEATYRGPETNAKVNSLVWHLDAGHAHCDLWPHTTYLATTETGVNKDVVTIRRWDARASCHYGPGPGVTFWLRHFDVLGDLEDLAKSEPEAAKAAGYTKMLCEKALEGCRKRAEESYEKAMAKRADALARGEEISEWIKPADDYARDMRMSREIDRLMTWAIGELGLEKDYVAIGRAEYREHLIEAYREGTTGIRRDTSEDLSHIQKMVERSEARAEALREAAQKALEEARKLKEDADLARLQVEAVRSGLDDDLEAARKARVEAEAARDNALREVAPILSDARAREQKLPELERAAEQRGIRVAFETVFPGKKPEAQTTAGIVGEIQMGISALRDETITVAKREAITILATARQDASDLRGRVVLRLRSMRNRMKNRDQQRMEAVAGLVLGKERVRKLMDNGEKLIEPVRKRLAWYQAAVDALRGIFEISPPKVAPETPLGKLAARVKELLASPEATKTAATKPDEKKLF